MMQIINREINSCTALITQHENENIDNLMFEYLQTKLA
jgi:hypothetical protein